MIFITEVALALDIIHVDFEGTIVVRESMLEILIAKFENLQISEEETIGDFN